ncbi:acetolactate synthase small subunit [Phycisphaerales bacterium AB-hyl4]|uniref:acetolactate synthase n=1 Tax=Natronomicrosphaera hydrolytica TaxID=3242702 RepID=A0ABV4U747_9BACT
MSETSQTWRHVIAALVTNEPGVLAQVAGMFAARGFNIDSLVVGRTDNPELSRMTIVVSGDDAVLEQVRKQLQKLVPVVKVVDYQDTAFVERDLMLVQVAVGDAHKRQEIITIADLFRAKVVDVASDRLMVELAGTEGKIEAFIDLVQPYGIVELARTGIIAMPRGRATSSDRPALAGTARRGKPSEGPADSGVDDADLPPG